MTTASPRAKRPREQSPHRVLGKEANRGTWEDLENVVVEIEITQFPSANQSPRGKIIEIIGYEE